MIKKENIPNMLCYLRIAAAPVVAALMCLAAFNEDVARIILIVFSGVVFGLAMVTDALDGRYARKHGIVSDKGKILDPLADKALIFGTMLSFLFYEFVKGSLGFYMIIPLCIILAREITVSALRNYTAKKGAVIGASIWGKVKTCIQTAACSICFFCYLFGWNVVAFCFICLAAVVTLVSLFPYLKMYICKLRELAESEEG